MWRGDLSLTLIKPMAKKKTGRPQGGWRPGAGRPKAKRTLSRDGKATILRFYPEEMALIEEAMEHMGYTLRAPFLRHCILHSAKQMLEG